MNNLDNLIYIEVSTVHDNKRLTRDDLKDLDDDRVGFSINRRVREIAEISGVVQFDVELQIEQDLLSDTGANVKVIKLEPVDALLVAEADVHLSSETMTLLGKEIIEEIAAGEIILDDDELKFTAAIDIQAK